jgi:hypothetical protein
MKKVFVLNKNGEPLMPTEKYGKVRRLIKDGKAEIFSHEPFTIKLLYDTPEFIQPITLGIDTGYSFIGISALTIKEELFGCELELRNDIKSLISDKQRCRSLRRSRLRYRAKRFDFRTRKDNWLPPSTQHKFDTHIKQIDKLITRLPITKIILETANFDIQKINNPLITSVEYQQGEQLGYWNIREYILHRDDHKCQNPDCKHKDDKNYKPVLNVHHIIYRRNGGSDKPSNLITLCEKCHTAKNHEKGFLVDWQKNGFKVKGFKDSTFMNIIKTRILNQLRELYPNIEITNTHGYITKANRIHNKIEKSHHNDAFIIAGGTDKDKISETINLKCERRNNRALQTFRDAKYIDSRDGEIKTGYVLNSGRTKRNKSTNGENLRQYRTPILNPDGTRKQVTKGNNSIRKTRYNFSKGAKIKITENWSGKHLSVNKNQILISGGTANQGTYIYIGKNLIPAKVCKEITNRKGIIEKL